MADQFVSKSALQETKNSIWGIVDTFQSTDKNKTTSTKFINDIDILMKSISDSKTKDDLYASVACVLGPDLDIDNQIHLLSKIGSDSVAADAAQRVAYGIIKKKGANGRDDGKKLYEYSEQRSFKIIDTQLKANSFFNLAKRASENNISATVYLATVERILDRDAKEIWQMELYLKIAELYQEIDDVARSINILDMLSPKILSIADFQIKDSLIKQACRHYLSVGKPYEAVELAKNLSPGSDLSLRRLAQLPYEGRDRYKISDMFAELIRDPKELFLVYESRMGVAKRAGDLDQMKEIEKRILKIEPELFPGIYKFEAYMILARYYVKINNPYHAKKMIEKAKKELRNIHSDQYEMFRERVESFEEVLNH
jgi:tetratricopeptide (TPR) repeat protein